jgi:hypothetical protein
MSKVRILAIPLLVALVLLIGMGAGACRGGVEDQAPPPEDGDEVTGQPHFTSDDGRIEIALDGVERTKELSFYEEWGEPVPEEGCDFVVVYMTLMRVEDGHVQFASGQRPTIVGDNGVEYQELCGIWDVYINDPAFVTSPESKPGATGTLAFELPDEVEPVSLRIVYLFFESWTESWELVGEEEKYIDIILP